MNNYDELKLLIDEMQTDYNKFYEKGVFSSGTKLRKALMEIRTKAQKMREEIQQIKNEKKPHEKK